MEGHDSLMNLKINVLSFSLLDDLAELSFKLILRGKHYRLTDFMCEVSKEQFIASVKSLVNKCLHGPL